MYVTSSSDIQLINCEFTANSVSNDRLPSYASRGGAVFIESSSEIHLINNSFVNNTARYSASALYAGDVTGIWLTRCNFTEVSGPQLPGPDNTILSLYAAQSKLWPDSGVTAASSDAGHGQKGVALNQKRPAGLGSPRGFPGSENLTGDPGWLHHALETKTSASAEIRLSRCRIESAVEHDHMLVSVWGASSISNSSVTCQSNSMSLHHAALPDHQSQSQLRQLSVWSKVACPTGYYAPVTDTRCHLTLQGRLTDLNDSGTELLCHTCPAHAHCDASLVHPDYNYYVLTTDNGRAQVLLCPDGHCQPSETRSGATCSEGRTGLLCADCDDAHVTSLQFGDVIGCESAGSCISYTWWSVVIMVFTILYVILLLLPLRIFNRQNHPITPRQQYSFTPCVPRDASTSDHVPANMGHLTAGRSLIGCLFPLVYFYQLLPSVYPRLMTSSWWLDGVLQFFVSLFSLYPAVGRGFCLDQLTAGDTSSVSEQRYFITMSVYWSQLLFIILLFSVLSSLFYLTRGPLTEQNIKMLASYFVPAFILFQLFSNVPLLCASLRSVHCVTMYNDSSVLFSDATTSCYSSWQIFSLFYVIVCVAPLCLVIDTAMFLVSRGRLSALGYLGLCLVPVIGLVIVPVKNLWATKDRCGQSERDSLIGRNDRGHYGSQSDLVDRSGQSDRNDRNGQADRVERSGQADRNDQNGRSDRNDCSGQNDRDEFEVDESTPEGLRSVSEHIIVIVQSVIIKPFTSYWPLSVADVGWMTIILVRNMLVCSLSVMLAEVPSIRSLVVTLLCLFFAVDQFLCGRYTVKAANWLDTSSWLMMFILAGLDFYTSVLYEAGYPLSTWSAVDWIARFIASLLLVFIIIVVVIVITRAVRRRRTRPL